MMRVIFYSSVAARQIKPATMKQWLQPLRNEWRAFAGSKPGRRFEERYRRRAQASRSGWQQVLLPAVGLLIITLGLILLPAPGPGIPVVLFGFALIAERFLWAARALDRCEPPLRTFMSFLLGWWRHASTLLRRMVALFAGLLALAAGALVFALVA